MKNLLILSRTFPPVAGVGSLRPAGFARLLPEFGWTPVVITVAESSLPATRLDPSLMRFVPTGITVRRVRDHHAEIARAARSLYARLRSAPSRTPAAASPPASTSAPAPSSRNRKGTRIGAFARGFTLPDISIGWAVAAIPAGMRELARCSAIYSCGLPLGAHLAAGLLARFSGKPWICDFRDPYIWPGMRHFASPWHARIGAWLEARVLRSADAIVTVGTGYARSLTSRVPSAAPRMHVIMNGYDGDLQPPLPPDPAGLRILHAGSLHSDEALRCLIQAVDTLIEDGLPVTPILVGPLDAAQQKLLQSSRHPARWELCGRLPQAEAFERMRHADVLLVESCGVIASMAIRAKIFEYLQLQKPVIAITDEPSAMGDLIRSGNLGHAVAPNEPHRLATLLSGMHARRQAGQPLLAPPAPDYTRYSRRASTRQLADILNRLCQPPDTTKSSP